MTCSHCGRRTADVRGDPPLCDLARELANLKETTDG